MTKKPINIAYLRVSTEDQDLEKNKAEVLHFANDRDFGKVKFVQEKVSGKKSWKERKIKTVIDELGKSDRIIVPELTRLGRSTLEVLEILKTAKDKDIAVHSVKEGLNMNGSIQAKIMSTMLALFSELERDFISMRTKEALKARKAAGCNRDCAGTYCGTCRRCLPFCSFHPLPRSRPVIEQNNRLPRPVFQPDCLPAYALAHLVFLESREKITAQFARVLSHP